MMPRKPAASCKIEGCTEPFHIYPNGVRAAYCSKHLFYRKGKVRKGMPSLTGSMQAVLTTLRDSLESDWPFIPLPVPEKIDRRTITALEKRDWIFVSPGHDGVRYKITSSGLKALEFYEPRINRRDGICPRCGERPRHVRSSGHKDGHCIECQREVKKGFRDRGIQHIDPNRGCSRCGKSPLHQWPNGNYSTYCWHCTRVTRRRNARKQRIRLFKAVQKGAAPPPCKKCKVAPRRVFINCLSEYCIDCGRTELRKTKLRKVLKAHYIG